MGLLEKIINQQIQKDKHILTTDSQSLLKKAESLVSSSVTEKELDKKKNLDTFESEIIKLKKKKKNLSGPFEIFDYFIEYFNLTKGALLVYDDSSECFSTWSITGYDYTTANRLNIPFRDAESLINSGISPDEKYIILKNNLSAQLRKYFSSREYGILESLLIIPFYSLDKRLYSFILISDLGALNRDYNVILDYYGIFYPVFNDFLYYFYKNIRLQPDNGLFISGKNALETINDLIRNNLDYSNYFAAVFDINNFYNILQNKYNFHLQSSFQNNLIRLFSAFASGNGHILILDNNKICIVKGSTALNDKQIIAHQIMVVIKSLIPVYDNNDSMDVVKVFHLPADNEILKDFFNA